MPKSKSDSIARGALRIGGARLAVRGLGLISTLVTARLLTPADFGLVAIAVSVKTIMMAGSALGFDYALIHFQAEDEEIYGTAWTLNVLRGILLAAAMVALAHPLAQFLHSPRLFWIVLLLAVVPVLEGFQNIWLVRFEMDMRFSPLSWLMIAVKLSGALTTIILAVVTRSYWSLIIGIVVSAAFRTLLSYPMYPRAVHFTLKGWQRLMAFSGWLAGGQVLVTMATKLDDIILQKVMAAHAVGIFYTSRELTTMMFTEIGAPLRRVLFPALSKLKSGSAEFRELYLLSASGMFMVIAPLGVGLALVAGEAVPVLLGSQWHEAIAPVRWLALLFAARSLGVSVITSINAAGATKVWFWRNLFFLPVRLGVFIAGLLLAGLSGAVMGFVAGGFIGLLLNLVIAQKVIGQPVLSLLAHCSRSLLALAGMALAVVLVRGSLPASGWLSSDGAQLVLLALVGGSVYAALHLLLWHWRGRPDGPERRVLEKIAGVAKRRLSAA